MTRNSAMAAMNKIKAGNIQLGTRAPTVSCACLVVYSGEPDRKVISNQMMTMTTSQIVCPIVCPTGSLLLQQIHNHQGVWFLNLHCHVQTGNLKLQEGAERKHQ